MLVFYLVLWSIALVGAVIIVLGGWRGGLVNKHLLCRGCRFNLSGHAQVPDVCPECGRDLTRSRATVRGERLSVPLVLATGLLTLLLTGVGLSGTVLEIVRPALTNLQGVNKEKLLVLLQDYGRPREQEFAAKSLALAIQGDKLDHSDAQRVYQVLRDIPIVDIVKSEAWSNLLVALFDHSLLTRGQMLDVVQEMTEIDVEISTQAWPGHLRITVGLRPIDTAWTSLLRQLIGTGRDLVTISNVEIAGKTVDLSMMKTMRPSKRRESAHPLLGSRYGKVVDLQSLPDGRYPIVITAQLEALEKKRRSGQPPAWDRSSAFRNTRIEQFIDVSNALPEPIMVPADSSLRQVLQDATTIAVIDTKPWFDLQISFDQTVLPVGIVGEAVLRYPDDRLIYLGRVQVLPGRSDGNGSLSTYSFQPWMTGFSPGDQLIESPVTVEVIPWIDHPMLRDALDRQEPLQLLADPVVLGVIQPDDLAEVEPP